MKAAADSPQEYGEERRSPGATLFFICFGRHGDLEWLAHRWAAIAGVDIACGKIAGWV